MEVSESLLAWLDSAQALQYPITVQNGIVRIDEEDLGLFMNGWHFASLLSRVHSVLSQTAGPLPDLAALKPEQSTAAKLFNWNLLLPAFSRVGARLALDEKTAIVSGNQSVLTDVLKRLMKIEYKATGRLRPKPSSGLDKGAIQLGDVKVQKPLEEASNCLEFLVLSICNCFSVTPIQAAGLLTEGSALMSRILANGFKGSFEAVQTWLNAVTLRLDTLTKLVLDEPQALELVCNLFQAGVTSKDDGSALAFLKTLRKFYISLSPLKEEFASWVAASGVILNAHALLRRTQRAKQVSSFLWTVGETMLMATFEEALSQTFPLPEYFHVVLQLLPHLLAKPQAQEELENQEVVLIWLENALKASEGPDRDLRLASFTFIGEIWASFPSYMEANETVANNIIVAINKTCVEKSRVARCLCFGRLFYLFGVLTDVRSSYAPLLYRNLIFGLVENCGNTRVREFLLVNFTQLLQELPDLPISEMVESLTKQISALGTVRLNTTDYDFFVGVARHAHLSLKAAILTLDVLSKPLLQEVAFGHAAEIPLLLLVARFLSCAALQEFLTKFVSVGLGWLKQGLLEHSEETRDLSYLRRTLFTIIDKVAKLGCEELNQELRNLILQADYDCYRTTGQHFTHVNLVLRNFGNAAALIHSFEVSRSQMILHKSNSSAVTPYTDSHKSLGQRNQRVKENLYRIRLQREIQCSREREQRIQQERNHLRQRSALRKALETRSVQLGVISHSATVLKERKWTPSEDVLYDIEEEPEFEQELVGIVLKRYSRISQKLFNEYANTGYRGSQSIPSSQKLLKESELCKLLRNHYIIREMVSNDLIKKLYKALLTKNRTLDFTYELFLNFLYQIALRVFSQSPRDLRHYPSAVSLKALFEYFAKTGNHPLHLYEQSGAGDPDIVQLLNEQLDQGKQIKMPPGYQRVKEQVITVSFEVPEVLEVPTSYKVALECIDDLLNEVFKFHILEPVIEVQPVHRVHAVIPDATTGFKAAPNFTNLAPFIKVEAAKLEEKYSHDLLAACAHTLDDLIHSVENGGFSLMRKKPRPAGSVFNKVIGNKLLQQEWKAREQEIAERKRKRHVREVSVQMERIRKVKVENELRQSEERAKHAAAQKELERKQRERYLKQRQEKGELIRAFQERKIMAELQRQRRSRSHMQVRRSLSVRPVSVLSEISSEYTAALSSDAVTKVFKSYQESFNAIIKHYNRGNSPVPSIPFNSLSAMCAQLKLLPSLIDSASLKQIYQKIIKEHTQQDGLRQDNLGSLFLLLAMTSKEQLRKDLNQPLSTPPDQLKGLFEWLKLPTKHRATQEFLRSVEQSKSKTSTQP